MVFRLNQDFGYILFEHLNEVFVFTMNSELWTTCRYNNPRETQEASSHSRPISNSSTTVQFEPSKSIH